MTVSSSQVSQESRTRSRQTDFMRRHTTELFQIVCWLLQTLEGIANGDAATTPSCPSAVMQWQHGTFVENADGSLTLSPFSVDGRELISDPCSSSTSSYLRYDQSETMEACLAL
jgi:hypothetical protein